MQLDPKISGESCIKKLENPKKKLRRFEMHEFKEKFPILAPITFRPLNGSTVFESLTTVCLGYHDKFALGYVILGNVEYDLLELFERYEYYEDGVWKPFGVER